MRSKSKTSPRKAHTAVNHRRVFTVLASLVAALAATAGLLLLLEGQPITSAVGPYLMNLSGVGQNWSSLVNPSTALQNGRWNYIIVYQSGSLSGNTAELADGRHVGGSLKPNNAGNMTRGADFHFVVDNADNGIGNPDGYVQQGMAWQKQLSTAPFVSWPYITSNHYSAYANAVGVCVIGNINQAAYSPNQVRSLTSIVQALQNRLNIPNSCVKMQWEIRGATTARERAFSREFHRLLGR